MDATTYVSRRQVRRRVLFLFAVAAVLRVGWVAARYSGGAEVLQFPDEQAYCQVARSLADGRGLVDEFGYRATYMPGYPVFLAALAGLNHWQLWARLAQALLAAWVAPATCLLAGRWLSMVGTETDEGGADDSLIPLLAGLAAAFDPFLVFFSGLLLTEALFAAVLVTAWALVLPMCQRNRRIGVASVAATAVMLWLCVMLRPAAAMLLVLVPGTVTVSRRFDRSGLVAAAAVLALVLAGLVPWAARNQRVIGQWRWLTTRGGISLYDGVQPGAVGASDLAHTKTMPEVAGMNELQWDAWFRARARAAVREDPLRILRLAGSKFLRTWSPWPNVEAYRRGAAAAVGATWTLAALLLAAVGWWRCRRAVGAWVILLVPVVAFTLLHMVFVGSVRYRVPVMPMMLVLSASGLAGIIRLCRGGRRRAV